MRILIAYGSKYGSTAEVVNELTSVLEGKGHDVETVDLKRPYKGPLDGFDMVVVGSPVIAGNWLRGPKNFLKQRADELKRLRLAVFHCGSRPYFEKEGEQAYDRRYGDDILAEYGLESSHTAYLGGVFDFQRYSLVIRKLLTKMGVARTLEENGFDPTGPCDLRDWDAIRAWADEIVWDVRTSE